MSEDILGDSWDLAEVLAERAQPKGKVAIYLNEVASHAKKALLETQARTQDEKALKIIDDELDEIEKQLQASKYTINITAVPSRMREDLASKAIHKFPIKANFMGQDDPNNLIDRKKYESDLIWHAQIESVENPRGQVKRDWTQEEISEFAKALPTTVQQAIDAAITKLTKDAEEFTLASSDPDF